MIETWGVLFLTIIAPIGFVWLVGYLSRRGMRRRAAEKLKQAEEWEAFTKQWMDKRDQ